MILIGQSKRLSEPVRWGRREKTAVGALVACAVLAVVGLGAYALTSGSRARADCIEVTFASTVGGATVDACGQRARVICASPGDYRSSGDALREACRRAGFPFVARR
jgi:hypothetical protein